MSSLRRGAGVVVAGAMLVLATGCAYTLDARGVGVPVTMASTTGEKVVGAPFKVTRHITHAFFGLATINNPSLARILEGQLLGAKSVADVHVRVRSRWSDLLFTVITAGIIVPRSITIEGTVVGVAPPDTTAAIKPKAKKEKEPKQKSAAAMKADSTAKAKADSLAKTKVDSTLMAKPDTTKH